MSVLNEPWKVLFERHDIPEKVARDGLFTITADEIRTVKEPRLMTKFDTRESLPPVFAEHKLAILPVAPGRYVIGNFSLYQPIPDTKPHIRQFSGHIDPESFETIDINAISSEANAINAMNIAGILEDFLGEARMVQTVSGRMRSGEFSFLVDVLSGGAQRLEVKGAQVEIDGGFEGSGCFSILEAKNVVRGDFLVRQLFYPTRLWAPRIQKPVRPVFLVYSNNVFRLLEYEFADLDHYNSTRLLREQSYSLEDTRISRDDLAAVYRAAKIRPEPLVTFIQADSFERVISLVEHLGDGPLGREEIADLFGFKERQADYYFNAARYLSLAEKRKDKGGVRAHLTPTGQKLLRLPYKTRQLEYLRLMLEHRIFNEMFEVILNRGTVPDAPFIAKRIAELGLCGKSASRRASSVRGWLFWIVNLIN